MSKLQTLSIALGIIFGGGGMIIVLWLLAGPVRALIYALARLAIVVANWLYSTPSSRIYLKRYSYTPVHLLRPGAEVPVGT